MLRMKKLIFVNIFLFFTNAFSEEEYCTVGSESCSDESLSKTILLNDGVSMPLFGLGLWRSPSGGPAEHAVYLSLKSGYRLLDTAQIYGNEEDVGRGILKSEIARNKIFVVSKVYTDNHGYEKAYQSVLDSLVRLQMEYVDLFLIHSPYGGLNVETYRALLDLKKEGKIRSVGVSNFEIKHLEGLISSGLPVPSVNQIELHPFHRRESLVEFCKQKKIAVMGYSPLVQGYVLDDPQIVAIGKKHHKSAAQVLIRWSLQKGYITIPKTVTPQRIYENVQVFDFTLDQQDLQILDNKEQGVYGWNSSGYEWEG